MKERPYYHLRLDPQVIFAIVRGDKPLMPEVDEQTASRRKILRLWDICRLCWMNQPESRLPMPLVVAFLPGDDDDENNNIDTAQALRLWSGLPVKSLPYFEEIGASAKQCVCQCPLSSLININTLSVVPKMSSNRSKIAIRPRHPSLSIIDTIPRSMNRRH